MPWASARYPAHGNEFRSAAAVAYATFAFRAGAAPADASARYATITVAASAADAAGAVSAATYATTAATRASEVDFAAADAAILSDMTFLDAQLEKFGWLAAFLKSIPWRSVYGFFVR